MGKLPQISGQELCRVVGKYFSGKIFSDKVKKTLKFFFNLRGRACGDEG